MRAGGRRRSIFVFRDVIAKATGVTPPPVPEVAAPIAIAPFKLTEAASLWDDAAEADRERRRR